MADIAMLVAEEYERRVKNSSKKAGEIKMGSSSSSYDIKVGSGSTSYVSALADRFGSKVINGEEKMEMVKWALVEPKSQIGLAASNGFFSA